MMNINIVCVGRLKEDYLRMACAEYEKRLGAFCRLKITELTPARLPEEKLEAVRAAAVNAFRSFGCSGLTRVDFFVRRSDGEILLNEPNTIPGFTEISMYPKLFAASGIPYPELLDKLINYAIERQ